jgi:hypothetical protein
VANFFFPIRFRPRRCASLTGLLGVCASSAIRQLPARQDPGRVRLDDEQQGALPLRHRFRRVNLSPSFISFRPVLEALQTSKLGVLFRAVHTLLDSAKSRGLSFACSDAKRAIWEVSSSWRRTSLYGCAQSCKTLSDQSQRGPWPKRKGDMNASCKEPVAAFFWTGVGGRLNAYNKVCSTGIEREE